MYRVHPYSIQSSSGLDLDIALGEQMGEVENVLFGLADIFLDDEVYPAIDMHNYTYCFDSGGADAEGAHGDYDIMSVVSADSSATHPSMLALVDPSDSDGDYLAFEPTSSAEFSTDDDEPLDEWYGTDSDSDASYDINIDGNATDVDDDVTTRSNTDVMLIDAFCDSALVAPLVVSQLLHHCGNDCPASSCDPPVDDELVLFVPPYVVLQDAQPLDPLEFEPAIMYVVVPQHDIAPSTCAPDDADELDCDVDTESDVFSSAAATDSSNSIRCPIEIAIEFDVVSDVD